MLQRKPSYLKTAAFFCLFVAAFSFGLTCFLFAVVPSSEMWGVFVAMGPSIGT